MEALLDNFWVVLLGKVVIVATLIPVAGLAVGFAELKLSAKMQNRIGRMTKPR